MNPHGRRRAMTLRRTLVGGIITAAMLGAVALAWATRASLAPLPDALVAAGPAGTAPPRILDRDGETLTTSYTGGFNVHDQVPLHAVPKRLRDAFILAEDKRFATHRGVDWRARFAAVVANIANLETVRGASTITEQAVRMLHPRPRTLWSRWVEGFDAMRLERRFSKAQILEFYLNQVPYASNRRGVVQAARHYFSRDLETLSLHEMLTLAVLVRAPSRLDPFRHAGAADGAVARLADRMRDAGQLDDATHARLRSSRLQLHAARLDVVAPHFVRHARAEAEALGLGHGRVVSTLDGRLQTVVQGLLDRRVAQLEGQGALHGAVLVADHEAGEVLAWVVAGGAQSPPRSHIDAVTTPRQPGSALKPLLYALALDSGMNAADLLLDAPLVEMMSGGLHSYRNYSGRFYGPVTLREALGNSLNIPALRTLQQVGAERFLAALSDLGFAGLTAHPDVYGDGIALGNGAVTLLELVEAYAALAQHGAYRPLSILRDDPRARPARAVFTPEAASIIADILADPDARALEFGRDSVLALPHETAVKTGTSSDFRDAWAVGFDHRYVVGVWLGDLDQRPTDGITGSTGPALLLRSVFAELTRHTPGRPLYRAPTLTRRSVCVPRAGVPDAGCVTREEWFMPQHAPSTAEGALDAAFVANPSVSATDATPVSAASAAALEPAAPSVAQEGVRFRQPTPGLRLAYDPRVPAASQAFELRLDGVDPRDHVVWEIDGETFEGVGPTWLWPVSRGEHRVGAAVYRGGVLFATTGEVPFIVK